MRKKKIFLYKFFYELFKITMEIERISGYDYRKFIDIKKVSLNDFYDFCLKVRCGRYNQNPEDPFGFSEKDFSFMRALTRNTTKFKKVERIFGWIKKCILDSSSFVNIHNKCDAFIMILIAWFFFKKATYYYAKDQKDLSFTFNSYQFATCDFSLSILSKNIRNNLHIEETRNIDLFYQRYLVRKPSYYYCEVIKEEGNNKTFKMIAPLPIKMFVKD